MRFGTGVQRRAAWRRAASANVGTPWTRRLCGASLATGRAWFTSFDSVAFPAFGDPRKLDCPQWGSLLLLVAAECGFFDYLAVPAVAGVVRADSVAGSAFSPFVAGAFPVSPVVTADSMLW